MGALISAKDAEISRLEGIYRKLLESAGVDLIEGKGIIIGPNEVLVNGKTLTAERILIAVGGVPSILNTKGMAENAITSNEALDLKELPEKIIIQGGGYIALEFAGIFASLGSDTHLIFRSEFPLRGFDDDVRAHVAKCLTDRGVKLHPNTSITKVEKKKNSDKLSVFLDNNEIIDGNQLLAATGRKPNTVSLGLDEIGVKMGDAGQILVSEKWSNFCSIYFCYR